MEIDPVADTLCEQIIGGAIAVHTTFGPGLLESVYQECLALELAKRGLLVQPERRVKLVYLGRELRDDLKIDLFVGERVVVETKAVARIHEAHVAQVITYLKLAAAPAGLLINFNVPSLRSGGIRRLEHPDIYAKRRGVRERFSVGRPPSTGKE